MYTANVVKVMIASPSDVDDERDIIRRVVQDWNAAHSELQGLVLMPVGWDTHATPEAGSRPQAIINKQLLATSDLLVAVFWTRIGSPTGAAISGTVEEITAHVERGRPAMIYFSARPIAPHHVDAKQFESLRRFRDRFKKQALVEEYEDVNQFKTTFTRQLAQTVNANFRGFREPEQDGWDTEKAKYRLVTTTGGANVWEYLSDPHHYACPACYANRSIHFLQDQGTMSGKAYCPQCKTSYRIRPMEQLPAERAKRGENAWE